jgi:hypothetical protein
MKINAIGGTKKTKPIKANFKGRADSLVADLEPINYSAALLSFSGSFAGLLLDLK